MICNQQQQLQNRIDSLGKANPWRPWCVDNTGELRPVNLTVEDGFNFSYNCISRIMGFLPGPFQHYCADYNVEKSLFNLIRGRLSFKAAPKNITLMKRLAASTASFFGGHSQPFSEVFAMAETCNREAGEHSYQVMFVEKISKSAVVCPGNFRVGMARAEECIDSTQIQEGISILLTVVNTFATTEDHWEAAANLYERILYQVWSIEDDAERGELINKLILFDKLIAQKPILSHFISSDCLQTTIKENHTLKRRLDTQKWIDWMTNSIPSNQRSDYQKSTASLEQDIQTLCIDLLTRPEIDLITASKNPGVSLRIFTLGMKKAHECIDNDQTQEGISILFTVVNNFATTEDQWKAAADLYETILYQVFLMKDDSQRGKLLNQLMFFYKFIEQEPVLKRLILRGNLQKTLEQKHTLNQRLDIKKWVDWITKSMPSDLLPNYNASTSFLDLKKATLHMDLLIEELKRDLREGRPELREHLSYIKVSFQGFLSHDAPFWSKYRHLKFSTRHFTSLTDILREILGQDSLKPEMLNESLILLKNMLIIAHQMASYNQEKLLSEKIRKAIVELYVVSLGKFSEVIDYNTHFSNENTRVLNKVPDTLSNIMSSKAWGDVFSKNVENQSTILKGLKFIFQRQYNNRVFNKYVDYLVQQFDNFLNQENPKLALDYLQLFFELKPWDFRRDELPLLNKGFECCLRLSKSNCPDKALKEELDSLMYKFWERICAKDDLKLAKNFANKLEEWL